VAEVDDHRILTSMLDVTMDAGYRPSWRIENAGDYGGSEDRSRLVFVAIRDDVEKAVGEFKWPSATSPDRNVSIREFLDDPNDVDWKVLEAREYHADEEVFDGAPQVYYDDRGDRVGYRRLSERECCRAAALRPRSTPLKTRQMLNDGMDGHVLRAVGGAIADFVAAFRVAIDYKAPRAMNATNKMSRSLPTEVGHGRFACPGQKAAQKLGWKQCADFFCDSCAVGKTIHTDANRDPVPKEQCVGYVSGDILGKFQATSSLMLGRECRLCTQ
jgi:site-specific DNA-cytosine methylase